jgi:TonB family protein
MLPRALVFSSDEQASKLLRQVLSELQVEVSYCREIFAAVEELTSRTFQIIVIDWCQELEASFLLNMARDLKSTRNTHTLVAVDAQLAPILVVNPDSFLEKPFTAEQARIVLLQCPALRALAQLSPPPASSRELQGQRQAPTSADNLAGAKSAHINNEPGLAPLVASATRSWGRRISSSCSNSQQERRLVRPGNSSAKKTVALGCLLALLVAVVRGEKQLGYLPAGLFGYDQVSKQLFSRQRRPIGGRLTTSSQTDVKPLPELSYVRSDDFERTNYARNFSGKILVRPIFGQGFSSLQTVTRPLTQVIEAEASTQLAETTGPTGANPLIPASLYRSAHLFSLYGGTSHPAITPANWSTGPIMIPEEMSRALLTHQVLPSYPLEALHAGLQGTVVLQALVGRDGSVEDLKLVEGYFALGNAAIAAVKQWRFRPYRLNGEIVEMQTLLTLTFPLNSDPQNRASSDGSLLTYGAWK